MSDKREQAIKDVAKAADNSPSYIRLCLRDVKMPCDDSLIFQFAVTQREQLLALREAVYGQDGALEKLKDARNFISTIECDPGLTTNNLIAQIDAAKAKLEGLR